MRIEKFEDIYAWQKGRQLVIEVYRLTEDSRDYSFRDQLRRASISVMNNIAEGFERNTNQEFKHFLYIAKGSCGEVRSMLYLTLEFNYFTTEQFNKVYSLSVEISRLLAGLIKSL
ncbi:MAG: four helix bundle protein [Candidatus Buchananbacteria bacterium]